MIGSILSHYRIVERLGQGGMGEVFRAEDLHLRRTVAIKMLRRDASAAPAESRARLMGEARAASSLNHPGIAVVYEAGEAEIDGRTEAFIALEHVVGVPIVDFVRTQGSRLDEILDLVRQVAEALGEAHRRGVVHRDIKPSNVMVTGAGRTKILDFGLARLDPFVDAQGSETWTKNHERTAEGRVLGTVAYMSPEQALGKGVDSRSDIFSLGVLFYELVAGRKPFEGSNAVATFDAILREEPPPLPRPLADPRLAQAEAVLRKMLSKDRDERHADMGAVCADLDAVRGAALVDTRPAATTAPSIAVFPFVNIMESREDDWLGAGIAETVATDLRGISGLSVVSRDRVQEAARRLGINEAHIDGDSSLSLGRYLSAGWVVSGAFQRVGDAVRVTAREVAVATPSLVRTVKIDGRMSEIFDVQDRVVRELSAHLRLAPRREGAAADTLVVAAYEAFSKGLLNQRLETYESLDRATVFFERAVALDPQYVRARLELGAAYASKAEFLGIPDFQERALAEFRRAVGIDPLSVSAHRGLGLALVASGKNDEGIVEIERAIELSGQPGASGLASVEDPSPLSAMGRALFIGRADFPAARDYFERALALNPKAGWYWLQLAHCCCFLGELVRAREAATLAATLQEESLSGPEGVRIVGAYMRLGQIAALEGKNVEAVEHFEREAQFLHRMDHALRNRIQVELNMRLGGAQQRLGDTAAASASLRIATDVFEERARLGADEPFTRYYAACAYALGGKNELAIETLAQAARLRPAFTVVRARIEPAFESLRRDSRFLEIVR